MAHMDRHTLLVAPGGFCWLLLDECSQGHSDVESRVETRQYYGKRRATSIFSSTLLGGDRKPAGAIRFIGKFSAGDRLIFEGFDPGSE